MGLCACREQFCVNSHHSPEVAVGGALRDGKASKFGHMQLRSVLDKVGAAPDPTWRDMVSTGAALISTDIVANVACPSTAAVEAVFLDALDHLAYAFESPDAFMSFYRHFGWSSADEYFSARGEYQVMVVDVDHNDLDDRLAIIFLAYQVASANAERRKHSGGATCTICLDARTYETTCSISAWRVLELATRLEGTLTEIHGVFIDVVFTDRDRILCLAADYLGVPPKVEELERKIKGTGALLFRDGAGGTRKNLIEPCASLPIITFWLLGGICAMQVADLEKLSETVHIYLFEQALPGWQSMDVSDVIDSDLQPSWCFPPLPREVDAGYGVEPSNIRSSEESYTDTIMNYMHFQQVVASQPSSFTYISVGLARNNGFLPAPPGQKMLKIFGRPLNVLPGAVHVIKRAVDLPRAKEVFHHLMQAALQSSPDTIYKELCISVKDDEGTPRAILNAVTKHGTFMADAIFVALVAGPFAGFNTVEMQRRLAFVKLA